ncbi:hypothetical protein F4778DRAFT_436830 [Xylariomycetidae sp. FL2044]|nr:hypothetical protein F4778DRAFT_436830 [Xylariomycetidae sp. FL2044]
MATRYSVDDLVFLRESPLCLRPNNLPPAEEWMGPPPETFRNNQGNKATGADRNRNNDNTLLEQTNRRPGVDRHMSRNSANPEDIILAPPRTNFSSATLSRGSKPFDNDKPLKDIDSRDRFAFRARNGDSEINGGFRDRDRDRDQGRDGRNNFRRRGDGAEQDSDGGWSTVKPRKSFGHEGAERFHGRMGDRPDRFADRRTRDPEERENNERPRRNFGEFSKEKDGDDGDKPRRNGLNRNRSDQPWTRESGDPPPPRERFDRTKSWRDRGADDQSADLHHDKPRERAYDRRWDRDRDHRQEREPEWLDQPLEEQSQTHTQEDFKKFMESMKGGKTAKPEAIREPAVESPIEQAKVKSAPSIEMDTDKFFAAFGQKAGAEKSGNETVMESPKPTSKPKSGSRFQNFFSTQEESRRQTEPPTPAAAPAPANEINPLLAMAGVGVGAATGTQPDSSEKVAFQALLQKLQKQSLQTSTPPTGGFSEPPPPNQDFGPKSAVASPGPFPSFGQERRDEAFARGIPLQNPEIQAPRPQQNTQFAAMRPEQQMLHELIGHRHHNQAQSPSRVDQPPSRNSSSNAEFLMTLMQSARSAGPAALGTEQLTMRMPQPSRPAQIPPTPDRETDYQRERSTSQHQGGRPTGLPGFFDEPLIHHREPEGRPQPTQILQRPGPPGLEQMHPNAWMPSGGQQLPPPGRPMIPPPGLTANPRSGPMPGAAFPPNFPMGGFPPPDAMAGPPRNMGPPPGFYSGPPPSYMPPPAMGGFQGPDAIGFGFDGRGMPPPGAGGPFRRN